MIEEFIVNFLGLIIIFVIWSLVWKGLALYHSAKNRQIVWFIIFLITNTAGILPIIYLLVFRKDKRTKKRK